MPGTQGCVREVLEPYTMAHDGRRRTDQHPSFMHSFFFVYFFRSALYFVSFPLFQFHPHPFPSHLYALKDGMTALMCAVWGNKPGVLEQLIAAGSEGGCVK